MHDVEPSRMATTGIAKSLIFGGMVVISRVAIPRGVNLGKIDAWLVDEPKTLARLGQRIRELRKAAGWSQEHFAHECEIDRSYMGVIERGEANVTFLNLCKIASALNTDVAELTAGIPE